MLADLIPAGCPADNNLTGVECFANVRKQQTEIRTNYASIHVDVADNVVARSISVTEGTIIDKNATLGFSRQ